MTSSVRVLEKKHYSGVELTSVANNAFQQVLEWRIARRNSCCHIWGFSKLDLLRCDCDVIITTDVVQNANAVSSPLWTIVIGRVRNSLMTMRTIDNGHFEVFLELLTSSEFVKHTAHRLSFWVDNRTVHIIHRPMLLVPGRSQCCFYEMKAEASSYCLKDEVGFQSYQQCAKPLHSSSLWGWDLQPERTDLNRLTSGVSQPHWHHLENRKIIHADVGSILK